MIELKIGDRTISPKHPPFIVAEMSGNHQHSLERALRLVEAAKESGVHAIKIQTYTPDTITMDIEREEFLISDKESLWRGKRLYQLYQESFLPWDWQPIIFQRCRELGILGFSSPFDESAVDFLEQFDLPCYKIASPEIVDHELIRKIAKLEKPIILSTGASTLQEIGEAVEVCRSSGCNQLLLLKCTASYPTHPGDAHVKTIAHLSKAFDVPVGLSDHSLGIGVALSAISQGACLIEKHLTISRQDGAVDSAFSLEPNEFKSLVIESERAWEALGEIHYGPLPCEKTTLSHRPSLYFVEDLKAGEILLEKHVRTLRPGKGLPPKYLDNILGLTIKKTVLRGTPVVWDLFRDGY